MTDTTSTKVSKTHDERGKFLKGWKGGPGNPYAKRVALLRKAFFDAVTDQDVVEVVENLKNLAKYGEAKDAVPAARVLLGYALGAPNKMADDDEESQERDKLRSMSLPELAKLAHQAYPHMFPVINLPPESVNEISQEHVLQAIDSVDGEKSPIDT